MTPQEAENSRAALEAFYRSKLPPEFEVTLVMCPMPALYKAFPHMGEYAAEARVNGQPVPIPSGEVSVDSETFCTPSTLIVSLKAVEDTKAHLTKYEIDPYSQNEREDVPLIRDFIDTLR